MEKSQKTKLENTESKLKHDLRVQVKKFRNKKKMEERKRINQLSQITQRLFTEHLNQIHQ